MVQRLNAAQTRQIIRDLIPEGLSRFRLPEPLDPEVAEEAAAQLVDAGTGRVYGLFDDLLRPRGLLVGLVTQDTLTGLRVGYEHLWWSVPGNNGLPLLRAFEEDCRDAGCARIICGYSAHMGPQRMEKIYRKLGYEVHLTSMSKKV